MPPLSADLNQVPPCLVQAARDYSLPVRALLAIRRTEGGRTGTVSKNTNGSRDYGPFQINTLWARQFEAEYGVTAAMLTHDFCWSARAAAYIVRYEINLAGGNFWEGIGRYHSRTPDLKRSYIEKVYRNSLDF
jgi:hypothetical protein